MDKIEAHTTCLRILTKIGVPANALWFKPQEMAISDAVKLYQEGGTDEASRDAAMDALFQQFRNAVKVLAS